MLQVSPLALAGLLNLHFPPLIANIILLQDFPVMRASLHVVNLIALDVLQVVSACPVVANLFSVIALPAMVVSDLPCPPLLPQDSLGLMSNLLLVNLISLENALQVLQARPPEANLIPPNALPLSIPHLPLIAAPLSPTR